VVDVVVIKVVVKSKVVVKAVKVEESKAVFKDVGAVAEEILLVCFVFGIISIILILLICAITVPCIILLHNSQVCIH
jgi:hypothetical protein